MKTNAPQLLNTFTASQTDNGKPPLEQVSRMHVVLNVNNNQTRIEHDQVISEEPLQITLEWHTKDNGWVKQVFTITMRTPGDDLLLCLGLLSSEGQFKTTDALQSVSYEDYNQLSVCFAPGFTPNLSQAERQLISHSSCGLCGKTSLQAIELKALRPLDTTAGWLDPQQLCQLPGKLRQQQTLFEQSGGVHGAALFDSQYQLLVQQEDIGRHNAVDKVIGHQLLHGDSNSSQKILLVSGRVSFELVQKALMAEYPVLVSVGAPSSLAIDAAKRFDLTLIGFTKTNSFNVYHGHWRLQTNNQKTK
jgi:FdhD protein